MKVKRYFVSWPGDSVKVREVFKDEYLRAAKTAGISDEEPTTFWVRLSDTELSGFIREEDVPEPEPKVEFRRRWFGLGGYRRA